MKAKMVDKPPEPGTYLCQTCQTKFKFSAGELVCPKCGMKDKKNLVIIYIDDDPEQEQMYSEIDWHGGD